MHNFKHVIRERALLCASSVGSAPLVGVPEIFVITAITKSRNQRQKQKRALRSSKEERYSVAGTIWLSLNSIYCWGYEIVIEYVLTV